MAVAASMLGGLKKWTILMVLEGINAVCDAARPGVYMEIVTIKTMTKPAIRDTFLFIGKLSPYAMRLPVRSDSRSTLILQCLEQMDVGPVIGCMSLPRSLMGTVPDDMHAEKFQNGSGVLIQMSTLLSIVFVRQDTGIKKAAHACAAFLTF
jgi:hypothetical protein